MDPDYGCEEHINEIVDQIVRNYADIQPLDVQLDHSFLNDEFLYHQDKEKFMTILIVLNRPIDCPVLFQKLLALQDEIICSDGGANRLREYFQKEKETSQIIELFPKFIIGDLDSLTDETRNYYQQSDCDTQIMMTED